MDTYKKDFSDIHSFIILAYKESPYLENCIESLIHQTVKSEIIIATSTPSKFLSEIAGKYNLPLKINPHGKGITSDWNFALSCCKTQYCTLSHQDDLYFSDYSKDLLSKMVKYQKPIIGFTNYCDIDVQGVKSYFRFYLIIKRLLLWPFYIRCSWGSKLPKRLILAFGSSICCPSVTFNKSALDDFSFSYEFSINLDWDAWERLSKKDGVFVYSKKNLVAHRIHMESETSRGVADNRRGKDDFEMLKRFWRNNFLISIIFYFYSKSYKYSKI